MSRSWWSRPVGPVGATPARRPRPYRFRVEVLEDRVQPAAFTEAGTALDLVLGTGETVGLVATAGGYVLS